MSAAVVSALTEVRCQEVCVPLPEPGKVLVRTLLASICGSDLHIAYKGWNAHKFPMPSGHPGHEGVGEVVDGGGTEFVPGDLVLTVPNVFTSQGFAEYQLLSTQHVLRIQKTSSLDHLMMAQQLGTVIYGCKRLPPLNGKSVVVLGQGSAGLFHDFVLRKLGAECVIAVEPIPERLTVGIGLGIDCGIEVTGTLATEAIMDATGGRGVDIVVDAVGSTDTLNQTLGIAKDGGLVSAFGLPDTSSRVPFDWDAFFRKRLTMYAVHGSQDVPGLPDYREALDLISSGEIDVTPFVTHRFSIYDVQEAFNLADSKEDGAIKVSLTFQ